MKAWRVLALAGLVTVAAGAGWLDLNEAGKAAYARGDYATAERLFRQAITAAPDEPEVHYHHGVALTHLRRWAEAVAAYEKALTLRPPAAVAAAARQGLRSVKPLARPPTSAPPADDAAAVPARRRVPRAEVPQSSVPVRRHGGNWFVEVMLNDTQASTFLVDTGAAACAITPELADALGIAPDPAELPVLVRGVTGTAWGRRVVIPSVRVGETEARDVVAFVLPLPGLPGILGNTFLSRYTATLDPARALLTLHPH